MHCLKTKTTPTVTFILISKNIDQDPLPPPKTPSVLWNSMIHPFINMTIYGAIWYQGEANAGNEMCSYHISPP